MSSLSAILNSAASALSTYQSAISVTGQNISNADNEDYSTQTTEYSASNSVSNGKHIYGTGVKVSSITREIDQLLENQLTTELSTQAALKEEVSYIRLIEDLFTENTDDSLNTLLDKYWSAWEDLSDTPAVTTARNEVYATGLQLAGRFNAICADLEGMVSDLNREITTGVTQINTITAQIAELNQAIIAAESSGANANNLSDTRNALVDDLGQRIDIDITIKEDGSYLILAAGGLPLVEDQISHELEVRDNQVYWCGNSGSDYDITDDIEGGRLGGWLTMRDEIVPEIQAEFNELSDALIWSINYQHSQGAGQTFYTDSMEGTYATGKSGSLASLYFGDKIDYSRDYAMVINDGAGNTQTVNVDMGISRAAIYDIQGTGKAKATYELTVTDEGTLGKQAIAQSRTGGGVSSAASIAAALNAALSEQTLTITSNRGTETIEIRDSHSDVRRSAADIADSLNDIDGITATASATEAEFSTAGLSTAEDGDTIGFTLYVDGQETTVSFTVDSAKGTLDDQLEKALEEAVEKINEENRNTDLRVDGTTVESASGATIGIGDFEVKDNAAVTLGNYTDFDAGDTLSFTVKNGSQSVTVEVNLSGVDTTDDAAMGKAIYEALEEQLSDASFYLNLDEATGDITLATADGSALSLSAASGDTGSDASITVTPLGTSTTTGDSQLDFNGSDSETITPTVSTADYIGFALAGCADSSVSGASAQVGESGGAYDTAAIVTGSISLVMEPDISLASDDDTATGLFGTKGEAGKAGSMITLGGSDGYAGFDDGDAISFEVDGITISYTVTDPGTGLSDADQADQLYAALTAALPPDAYEVIRNGTSVSIVSTLDSDTPIEITDFTDATGNNATLAVSTGTAASGIKDPKTDTLVSGDALHNSTTAAVYGDSALIYWRELDSNGNPTGESGYVEVDRPGQVGITNADGDTVLSFNISEGNLTAGNTLRVNTDSEGSADVLEAAASGTANSIADTYEFTVTCGGTLPDSKETIIIEWTSDTGSGSLELESSEDPSVPVTVEVDGMTLTLTSGTLIEGDVFYISTNENGNPVTENGDGSGTVTTLSDWHWTLSSFADEFNRSAGGLTASVTDDNTLVLDTNKDYCAVDEVSYTQAYGISKENTTITVTNYTALEVEVDGLCFVRTGGAWEVANDPTGGTIQIIPQGGDDGGFSVDLDGDGVGDIEVRFDQPVTGDGRIEMDLAATESEDFSYAFAGSENGDSGLAAALGLNTYFTGTDAATMGLNELLKNGEYIASGIIDRETGEVASADNTNARAMAETRYKELEIRDWDYTRGEDATASLTTTSLDGYQTTLISGIGVTSLGVKTSLDYAKTLVYQLTTQRDSVSAVSLDEEMINLTAQQQAYSAAAQLLTTVDEMFQALINIR